MFFLIHSLYGICFERIILFTGNTNLHSIFYEFVVFFENKYDKLRTHNDNNMNIQSIFHLISMNQLFPKLNKLWLKIDSNTV